MTVKLLFLRLLLLTYSSAQSMRSPLSASINSFQSSHFASPHVRPILLISFSNVLRQLALGLSCFLLHWGPSKSYPWNYIVRHHSLIIRSLTGLNSRRDFEVFDDKMSATPWTCDPLLAFQSKGSLLRPKP